MEIRTYVVGGLQTNCYLAFDPETKRGFLVDPGSDPEYILEGIRKEGVTVEAFLLTHGHFDHVLALPELLKAIPAPYYIGERDVNLLSTPNRNMSFVYCGYFAMPIDKVLHDGDVLNIAGYEIHVFSTPGHTGGSVSYYIPSEKLLFSGDTLFFGTYGNTSLPSGSFSEMLNSLRNVLFKLPDDTRVLPGHDMETSIGREKEYNPLSAGMHEN